MRLEASFVRWATSPSGFVLWHGGRLRLPRFFDPSASRRRALARGKPCMSSGSWRIDRFVNCGCHGFLALILFGPILTAVIIASSLLGGRCLGLAVTVRDVTSGSLGSRGVRKRVDVGCHRQWQSYSGNRGKIVSSLTALYTKGGRAPGCNLLSRRLVHASVVSTCRHCHRHTSHHPTDGKITDVLSSMQGASLWFSHVLPVRPHVCRVFSSFYPWQVYGSQIRFQGHAADSRGLWIFFPDLGLSSSF